MTTELPQITQTFIDDVFKALVSMEVDLDENPLEYGPRRLNMKTADTRRKLAECEHLFLRVSGLMQKCRAAHRAAETELELEKKHLFANDPEVRAGRNVSTQDALASMKLRSQVEELSKIKTISEDLGAMLAVIKSKRNDLKDVQRRLSEQIKLCHEEIALGAKWGSRVFGKTPDIDSTPNPDHKSLTDLRKMFAGIDSIKQEDVGQILISKINDNPIDESSEEAPEDSQINSEIELAPLGSSIPAFPVKGSDSDADDLLNSISSDDEIDITKKKREVDIDNLLMDFDL